MLKGFLWLALLPLLFACNANGSKIEGSGNVVEEQRSLERFSAIEIGGNYTIELVQGEPAITITTDDNLLPYIQSEVKRNTLHLSSTENLSGSDGVTIRISYPELEKLELGGAATVSNTGTIKARNLELDVSGAGLIELALEVRKLELGLAGASSITLTGEAQRLQADLSGAGNLEAYELKTRDAVVNLSGIGSAEVYVTDNLQAQVSGVGGISYRGNPQNIQRKVSGVGSIEAASAGN